MGGIGIVNINNIIITQPPLLSAGLHIIFSQVAAKHIKLLPGKLLRPRKIEIGPFCPDTNDRMGLSGVSLVKDCPGI